jgi:hypothetical protein
MLGTNPVGADTTLTKSSAAVQNSERPREHHERGDRLFGIMGVSSKRILRPISYVAAAAGLSGIVGYLRGGSIGGALALSFAASVGVSVGILGFELWRRYFKYR